MVTEQSGPTPDQTGTENKVAEAAAIAASRRKLLTIIMIAFVPIFIAYILFFYFPALAPEGTTNRGQLISPPLEGQAISEALANQQSWVLIQTIGDQCDASCEELLYLSRQVTAGLGKDANRVKRVVVGAADISDELRALLDAEHVDVQVIQANTATLDSVTVERPVLFLMDPNANIMMYFSLDQAGKPMLRDLKHLLKISNIG